MEIAFRPILPDDLPELRSWFADEELSRRLSFPTDEWFSYVTTTDTVRCWLALADNRIIAQIQVDRAGLDHGYLDFFLRPDLRGQGRGADVLTQFLSGPGRSYPVLEGVIEPDNLASIACFRRCGFSISSGPDADGFFQAIHRSASND